MWLRDVAHIIADSCPRGEPLGDNGPVLCKLHHAAFGQNMIGISPDRAAMGRLDILAERVDALRKAG